MAVVYLVLDRALIVGTHGMSLLDYEVFSKP